MPKGISLNVKYNNIGTTTDAISNTHKIAEALGEDIELYFPNVGEHGLSLMISPKSRVVDIFEIYNLRVEIFNLKQKGDSDGK